MITTRRVHNFYAGPATMPLPALERAREEFLDFAGTGMSVMEISHRSKEYEAVHAEAEALLRELMAIPSNYHVLFLQGGASLQFAMAPMNLLHPTDRADYVLTDVWSSKAYDDARRFGEVRVAADAEDTGFDRIPWQLELDPEARYVHITSNNTLYGTQYQEAPDTDGIPLVADMSSDIASRPLDLSPYGLIYAGAQKNLGPSGVTVVIIRDDFLARCREDLPPMLSYRTHAKYRSLYNTPPTFAIYMLRNVLDWMRQEGGLEVFAKRNREKASLLYDVIDRYSDVYRGHAHLDSRSEMTVTFRLRQESLEQSFLAQAEAKALVGLEGHRLVGGFRASLYNAMTLEGVQALVEHMESFAEAQR